MKTTRVTIQDKAFIKDCIKSIPKKVFDYYNGSPYELMIYTHQSNGDTDLEDFSYFKGIRNLEKTIEQEIKNYGHRLSHIDFKWSDEEEEFDQFTIFTH